MARDHTLLKVICSGETTFYWIKMLELFFTDTMETFFQAFSDIGHMVYVEFCLNMYKQRTKVYHLSTTHHPNYSFLYHKPKNKHHGILCILLYSLLNERSVWLQNRPRASTFFYKMSFRKNPHTPVVWHACGAFCHHSTSKTSDINICWPRFTNCLVYWHTHTVLCRCSDSTNSVCEDHPYVLLTLWDLDPGLSATWDP